MNLATAGSDEERRRRDGFAVLLASQLAVLVLSPLADGPLGRLLINGYFTFVLFSALFSLRDDRRVFRLGLAVGIPAVLMIWMGARLEHEPTIVASQLLAAAFFAVTAVYLTVMVARLVGLYVAHEQSGGAA